jgi:hypothetical protein
VSAGLTRQALLDATPEQLSLDADAHGVDVDVGEARQLTELLPNGGLQQVAVLLGVEDGAQRTPVHKVDGVALVFVLLLPLRTERANRERMNTNSRFDSNVIWKLARREVWGTCKTR